MPPQEVLKNIDLVTKIVNHILDAHPEARQWGIMARGLGKWLNNHLFRASSPDIGGPLDWTGMLISRTVNIGPSTRPADQEEVMLPIHKADLVLVVNKIGNNLLEVNARRVHRIHDEWRVVDQNRSLQVKKDFEIDDFEVGYSVDVSADGRIGVLAAMPDMDEGEASSSEDEEWAGESIHIFDTSDMRELCVISSTVYHDAIGWVSTVKIDPSGCRVAVWRERSQEISIYSGKEYNHVKLLHQKMHFDMRETLHWADSTTLRWLDQNDRVLKLYKWNTVTDELTSTNMDLELNVPWLELGIAQPLGEAWYCSVYDYSNAARKYQLLNLDTMEVVRTAVTYQEIWGLQGCEGKFRLQGPYATRVHGGNTCEIKVLPRPVYFIEQ